MASYACVLLSGTIAVFDLAVDTVFHLSLSRGRSLIVAAVLVLSNFSYIVAYAMYGDPPPSPVCLGTSLIVADVIVIVIPESRGNPSKYAVLSALAAVMVIGMHIAMLGRASLTSRHITCKD